MTNEYYIIPIGQLASPILDNIVQSVDTVRKNINATHCVVKTYEGVISHPSLSAHQKYSHQEIKIEMAKPEWNSEI